MRFNQNLIDFFKRHNLYDEEMFNYFSEISLMLDYDDPVQRILIGCFSICDKKKKLKHFIINVPYIYDDITMLINIHELVHAIMLYKRLNKKLNIGIEVEVLPMLYEFIYIKERNTPALINFEKELNKRIDMEKDFQYILGLELRDHLLSSYDYDIDKLDKKVKKLVKQRKKNL